VIKVGKIFNIVDVVIIVVVVGGVLQWVDLTNKHASATTQAGAYSDHPPARLPT
jgi:hypothetical protein